MTIRMLIGGRNQFVLLASFATHFITSHRRHHPPFGQDQSRVAFEGIVLPGLIIAPYSNPTSYRTRLPSSVRIVLLTTYPFGLYTN